MANLLFFLVEEAKCNLTLSIGPPRYFYLPICDDKRRENEGCNYVSFNMMHFSKSFFFFLPLVFINSIK